MDSLDTARTPSLQCAAGVTWGGGVMAIWNAATRPAARGLRDLAARLESSPTAAWDWIERLQTARGAASGPLPRARGAVATPLWVAARMAERALERAPRRRALRVLDAGCGDGRLLVAVARAAAGRGSHVDCDGIELDPAAARWAQGLEPLVRAGAGAAVGRWRVRCSDFLASAATADLDVAIANPPYVAWRDLDAATRTALRGEPRSDLALVFVERLLDRLRPGGTLVAIVPNKLLVARYAAQARRRWRDDFAVNEIWDLSHAGVFGAHAAYPVVVVMRRARPGLRAPVRVLDAAGTTRSTMARRVWAATPDALVPLDMDPRLAAIAARMAEGDRLGDHVHFACGLASSGFARGVGSGSDRILRARDVAAFHVADGTPFDARRAGVARAAVTRQRVRKLVVPGMFRRLCAAYDAQARVVGRVYWTAPRDDGQRTLLLALLNSRLFALLYAGWFGAGAQSGGWLRANAPCLAALPWPRRTADPVLVALVARLERRVTAADRARLDAAVESLFELRPNERAHVGALARNLPAPDADPDARAIASGVGGAAALDVDSATACAQARSRPRRGPSRVGMDVA